MSIEFLTELEKKVDILINTLERLREENAALKGELGKKSGSVSEIEKENRALKNEITALKAKAGEQHEKLRTAAERIQGLIAKIEAV